MRKKDKYELDKICAYCERATPLAGGEHVLCEKKGVVTAGHLCRGFVYDPVKRIPKRAKQLPQVELDPLDDVPAVPETVKEENEAETVPSQPKTEDEPLSEVLPQLELPEVDDIP